MKKRHIGWIGLASLLVLSLAPSRAEAKGFMLITYGDSIKHVAELPADQKDAVRKATGQDGVAVGYAYSYFGVFWLDLWTWSGKHCLYKDRTIWSLEPTEAADLLKLDVSKLGKPFTYSVPPGLLIIGMLLLGFFVVGKISGKKGDDPPPPAEDKPAA